MVNKQSVIELRKRIKAVSKQLSKDRDALRQIISDAEDILDGDSMDEDIRDLERIADNLSQYV